MAIERRSPLPPGRYWIRLPYSEARAFEAWALEQSSRIRIDRTSEDQRNKWGFYIFRCLEPTPWRSGAFGWPNTADSSIQSESDLDQIPHVETDPLVIVESSIDKVGAYVDQTARAAGSSFLTGLVLVAIVAVVANRVIK